MKKVNHLIGVFLIGILTISHAFCQQNTLNLGNKNTYLNQLRTDLQNSTAQRKANPGIDVHVSNIKTLRLVPIVNQTAELQHFTLIGNVDGYQWANFSIRSNNGQITGQIIIHDTKEAFKYSSDKNGNIMIESTPIDKLICVDYATDRPVEQEVKSSDNQKTAKTNALDLQSLPGANGCILLDFDGHYVVGTNWEGGAAINSAGSGMSDAQVQEVWEIISEDYRPFSLNITTNEGVYNTYPQNRRRRCVFTPSNFSDKGSGGAGGLAFGGSFTWNNNDPCYVFMTGGAKAPAEGASHEIGHTLGLSHDGLTNPVQGYYEGQGNWAPIMGVGYYRPISQWSKGEYNFADEREDDLAIMANNNGLGYRNDQHGNTFAAAANLNINGDGNVLANNNYGIIERTGDVDVFRFATAGGNTTLNVNTVGRHGDLDIVIRLYNNAGQEINSSNPAGLNASINNNLAAGTYYLTVSGTGADNPATNGYSNYASLGSYWVSGFVTSPGSSPSPSTGVVTVYADIDYKGFSGGLSTGDYTLAQLQEIGIKNDDITSIKVSQGYKITLYADDNFTGTSVTITADNNYVGAFNDLTTSIRVRPNGNPTLAGTYFIKNGVSGLFMDLSGGNLNNGAAIQQYTYNGSDAQKFKLVHIGDGNYSIVSVLSNKVLDIPAGSQDAGALIQQWDNGNTKNQHFILFDAGNGLVKIIPEHSGKVVEVSTNNSSEQLHQWWNAGQANSFWRFMPATQIGVVSVYTDCNKTGFRVGLETGDYTLAQLYAKGFTDNTLSSMQVPEGFKVILYSDDNFTGKEITITNDVNCYSSDWNDQVTSLKVLPNGNPNLAGTYYIKNSASGFVVDLKDANLTNGAEIRQWSYNGSDAQKFKLVHIGNGNYTVVQVASNKVWDVNAISYQEGANIIQWDNANGRNQHFILVDAGNGLFKMIAEHTGMVAEVSTNNLGEQLHQWANAGQANSKWILIPTNETIGTGNGLRGNYFNGTNFETPVFTRLDSKIDFAWNTGSPDQTVSNDLFSVRWTGQVQAKSTGEYTFYVNSDNGRRLWVNNQLIIDKWVNDFGTEYNGTITLTAGQKYDIRLEYFENNGGAENHLSWSTNILPKEIIPQTQLYANVLPAASITTPTANQVFVTPSAVNITVTATDSDGSVAKVEFYNGQVKLGEDVTSPFAYNWTGAAKGTYTITVRAYDNRGALAISSAINFTVNDPVLTDMNDPHTISQGFAVYPNPAESTLQINTSEDLSMAQIRIFDTHGRLVSAPVLHTDHMYVGDLRSGFYIIEITNLNNKHVQRFIKK